MRRNCSSDLEKDLKFEAEGRKFAKILRSLNNLFKQRKVRTQLEFICIGKNIGIQKHAGKVQKSYFPDEWDQ